MRTGYRYGRMGYAFSEQQDSLRALPSRQDGRGTPQFRPDGVISIVALSYRTDLKEQRDEYFAVSDFDDRPLSPSEACALLSYHERLQSDGYVIDFDALVPDTLRRVCTRLEPSKLSRVRLSDETRRWVEAQHDPRPEF